jgi:hypothetical protein
MSMSLLNYVIKVMHLTSSRSLCCVEDYLLFSLHQSEFITLYSKHAGEDYNHIESL